VFSKSINYTASAKQKVFSAIWCLQLALLFAARPYWVSLLTASLVACVASIIFIFVLTRKNINVIMPAYLLSYGISYFLYYLTLFTILSIFAYPMSRGYSSGDNIDFGRPTYLAIHAIASSLHLFLSYVLFRIKRFRNGFPFLLKEYAVIASLLFTGNILFFAALLDILFENDDIFIMSAFLLGIIAIGVGIFIWIRKGIKAFYRRKIKESGIEILERELAEKDNQIRLLTEQNNAIRVANHKTTHRLATLERSIAGIIKEMPRRDFSVELGEELHILMEDIKRLSCDYQDEVGQTKIKKPLSSTKIKMIDDLFGYFSDQCAESNIDFNLKINGSIPYMVERVIAQSDLETMIGDHLQNALIAVNAGDNPFRSILALLGLTENGYEFTVFDSGIPFEQDTLMRLGVDYTTTHADTGGSGIGLMTTFEVMSKSKASLIISENRPSHAGYSKSITIRFDNKGQYIIETYRYDDFSENERYTLKPKEVLCEEGGGVLEV